MAQPGGRLLAGLSLGFVGVVVFGGTLPFTRLAVADLDPWFVTAGRSAIAGLIAGGVLIATRRRLPRPAALGRLLLVSLCVVGAFPIATGLAMTTVEASRGGVVLGILPLATAIVAALLGQERLPARFWAAALVGAGIVVAFALREGAAGLAPGDAYLVLAVLGAAVGYGLSGALSREMPGWEVISWALVVALPVTVPAALLLAPADPAAVSPSSWAGFVYVTVMSQYLGFFAWNAGLALGGVARVGQVQLLQVFVTLAVAAQLNGERVDLATWLTAGLVVAVVVVAARARSSADGRRPVRRPADRSG